MSDWVLVDDQAVPAAAFVDSLRQPELDFNVRLLTPGEARDLILAGTLAPDGMLMDVDLSDVPGEHGSGPGIAQDVRIKQENDTLPAFPVVRFAYRDKVRRNIGSDASSDDLFDLKFDKEYVAREVEGVRSKLRGCESIYKAVVEAKNLNMPQLALFFGLSEDELQAWVPEELALRAAAARADKPHIAAGMIMRLLTQPGPLIDRDLLFVRLGVDPGGTGDYDELLTRLSSFKYKGAGSEAFCLWWARALEAWWFEAVGAEAPLSSMSIAQRVESLRQVVGSVEPLVMPEDSPGTRPWRLCVLSLEDEAPRCVPVDPAFGVRVSPRSNLPSWADPLYAALGPALERKNDPRLSAQDLERLRLVWNRT